MFVCVSQKSGEIHPKDYIYVTLRHLYCQIGKKARKIRFIQPLKLKLCHTNDTKEESKLLAKCR